MKSFKEYMVEKLSVSDGQQAWIDDFLKSDAPQFKGKSKEEIVKMAVAAFNAAKDDVQEDAPANAVAHGGVDMNPTGKPKKFNDGRSRYDITKMFRRASVK